MQTTDVEQQASLARRLQNRPLLKTVVQQKYLILLAIPAITLVFIFNYIPMYGVIIAFKNFKLAYGIRGSEWVGFKWFVAFFTNPIWWRLMRNTFLLGFYSILFGFPAPIILALLLNEIPSQAFKRTVQTISYLPHFISTVIIVGMLKELTAMNGLFNNLLSLFGWEKVIFLARPEWFRTLYVGTGIWQSVGWGTIIYLAALTGIDPQLYESAISDGAGRLRMMWHIKIPSILPTTIILLILRVGRILATDFEKVLLMYNPLTYRTADIISTYVYREGLLNARYSYSAAVGLFMSVVAFVVLYGTNLLSRKLTSTSLW